MLNTNLLMRLSILGYLSVILSIITFDTDFVVFDITIPTQNLSY